MLMENENLVGLSQNGSVRCSVETENKGNRAT